MDMRSVTDNIMAEREDLTLSISRKDKLCEKCERLILTREQIGSRDERVSLGKYRDTRQRKECPV